MVKTTARVSLDQSMQSNHYLFDQEAWKNAWNPVIVPFQINKRSQEAEWSNLLARIRLGTTDKEDMDKLFARTENALRFSGEWNEFMEGRVTHIYPTNADVNRENNIARSRLPPPDHKYSLSYSVMTNLDTSRWDQDDQRHYLRWSQTISVIP